MACAYDLCSRFPPPIDNHIDPGSYQNGTDTLPKKNKVPFNSSTIRQTVFTRIWTHKLYHPDYPQKIPNCSSLKSKCPRFPYEAFSEEDLEAILCRCGLGQTCECPVEPKVDKADLCPLNVKRKLFIGITPRSVAEGLCQEEQQCMKQVKEDSPKFYDARVNESTAFYRGCKWSQWTSKRTNKSLEVRPGPADYDLERKPTEAQLCDEKTRIYRKFMSKQLRLTEALERRNILDGFPGPASYNPEPAKGTNLQNLGPKSERFPQPKYDVKPGPADYSLKRDFDLPECDYIFCYCNAKLQKPQSFGVLAARFPPGPADETPGPASYVPKKKLCKTLNCSEAPFGVSAVRFKSEPFDDFDIDELSSDCENNEDEEDCPNPSWMFKSKTEQWKPLNKELGEEEEDWANPIDLGSKRDLERQYMAPFYSSEGRFQPWFDWMPVAGKQKTPGPGYYSLEKPKCLPAFHQGPLYRSRRFSSIKNQTPAPNQYKVSGGIDTVLDTHNVRLKENIVNQHTFKWSGPEPKKTLNYEQLETLLWDKSISLLDYTEMDAPPPEVANKSKANDATPDFDNKQKPKLLRTFIEGAKVPIY